MTNYRFENYTASYFNCAADFHYKTWKKTYENMTNINSAFVKATKIKHIKSIWEEQQRLQKKNFFAPAIVAFNQRNEIVAIVRGHEHQESQERILKYDQVYVCPKNQRQGLGSALSYLLFYQAFQNDITQAVVEIDKGNNGSLSFQTCIGANTSPREEIAVDWRDHQKFENPIWVVTHPNLDYSMGCLQNQLQINRPNLWDGIQQYVHAQSNYRIT